MSHPLGAIRRPLSAGLPLLSWTVAPRAWRVPTVVPGNDCLPISTSKLGVPGLVIRLLALLAAAVLGLTACTGSGSSDSPADSTGSDSGSVAAQEPVEAGPPTPDRWRESVPLQPLTVPTEMVATTNRLDGVDVIAGTADRPALAAAIRTAPDGGRRLQLSAWDRNVWKPADVGPGVPGEPQRGTLAGTETVAALGGWTWAAGTIWPYLLTSTDRSTWTPVPLPGSLNSFAVTDVAVDGGRVVALAQGGQRAAALIVVDQGAAAAPTITALPALRTGEHRSLDGVAIAGDTIVLTGRQGPRATGPLLAFRSPDAGHSWAEPVTISANDEATAWGVTHLPGGFLVTGNDLIADDPGMSRQMAAWSSPDGIAWTAESVPEPDRFRWPDQDAALGAPTATGDYALAVAGSSNSRSARIFLRQPTGRWIAIGETNQVADGTGRLGRAAPISEPSGPAPPGALMVTIGGAHGTVAGRMASGVWTSDVVPAAYRQPPTFTEPVPGPLAVIRERVFLPFGDGGFRTINRPQLIGLDGDALTVRSWDPAEAADAEDVEIGVDGSAQVLLSARMSDDDKTYPIIGWFRSAPGQAWRSATGFGADRFESPGPIRRLGDRWVMSGHRADRPGGTAQAMVWTSADGVAWARADGDFADADRSSGIAEVCLDPVGRPIAVGWIRLTEAPATAAIWTERDGRWHRSTLPTEPAVGSSFDTCGSIGGRLVIGGELDGESRRWTVDTGGGLRPIDPPVVDAPNQPRGRAAEPFRLTGVRPVPGGYLAAGRLDTTQYTGRVLWLSADGARWTWVPVPTVEPNASLQVGADGGDVVVLSSSTNYSQAWRIPDIASIIASIPAG